MIEPKSRSPHFVTPSDDVKMACVDLSWLYSPKDYWYAAVSALIGAAIGISWTIAQFKKQRARETTRCLRRLKECLEFNVERLKQAKGQLEQSIIPNYPLDTAQLNHWISQAHDVLDADLLRSLDWQRYQLDHISSKFVAVSQSIVSSGGAAPQTPEQQQYVKAMLDSLLKHVNTILAELPPLIAKIPSGG
jgi:hypothetical protein